MEIGFMVEPQVGGSYEDLLALARWAEELGLTAFARSDHYTNMTASAHATDALTSFAGLARETSHIELTVLVTPLTFRHPGVIAKTAATLMEMSGGRFELGIGTGWMEPEHEMFGIELGPLGQRFDRFEEALGYLWAAFGRNDGGFSGEHFELAAFEVLPHVGRQVPIVIGGSGMKRTPALAGRYADEYNMFVTARETLDARLAVMRRAARDAGRDPDDVKISMVVGPVIGEDEKDYDEVLARRAATRDVEPAAYASLLDERGIPHGVVDDVAVRLAEIGSWGISRFYLQDFAALDEIDTDRWSKLARALQQI